MKTTRRTILSGGVFAGLLSMFHLKHVITAIEEDPTAKEIARIRASAPALGPDSVGDPYYHIVVTSRKKSKIWLEMGYEIIDDRPERNTVSVRKLITYARSLP
mgnify:CR=1 FL=1